MLDILILHSLHFCATINSKLVANSNSPCSLGGPHVSYFEKPVISS